MASSDNCYAPLRGELLRVVHLDDCGRAVSGAEAASVISDGFISVEFAPDFEAGQEFIVKNAKGDLCVNQKDPDRLKRINVTITLCQIDPAALNIILGDSVMSGGLPVGMNFSEEPNRTKASLEVWGGIAGEACSEDGDVQYEHLAIGWLENAHWGPSTVNLGPGQLQIMATTHRAPGFGHGYVGNPLPEAFGPKDHMKRYITDVAPPAPDVDGVYCGFQASAPLLAA